MQTLPVEVRYPLLRCFGVCLPLVPAIDVVMGTGWGCEEGAARGLGMFLEGRGPPLLLEDYSVAGRYHCRACVQLQGILKTCPDPVICRFMAQ